MKLYAAKSPALLLVQLFVLFVLSCNTAVGAELVDKPWVIHGDVVTEEGAQPGWIVFDKGRITSVGVDESSIPPDARVIKYDGYIFPGLIDTHNHVHWNSLPKWTSREFASRYEWQADPAYITAVNDPFYNEIVEGNLEPESIKYGEIRALTGGTTMIQSSYKTVQPKLLIKNLDASYHVDSYTGNIRKLKDGEVDAPYRQRVLSGLTGGSLNRLFFHVGEGKDSNVDAWKEFGILEELGLARPGVVVIHGMAFSAADFGKMKSKGMYLVWSPRSNWNLYRSTTDVMSALAAGVTVALAPDWTISGSDNLLEEMKFANAYLGKKVSSQNLFRMCTTNAAKVAGIDDQMGKLAPGYAADLFLAPHLAQNAKDEPSAKPFDSLLRTYPRHIHLVFVDGKPIYGDVEELAKWTPDFDTIVIEDMKKGVVTTGDASLPGNSEKYDAIEKALRGKLPRLAPLIED